MKHIYTSLTLIALLMLPALAHAKYMVWAEQPSYESVTYYGGNSYIYTSGGKKGLISPAGKVFLPAKYDFIDPYTSTTRLFGTRDNNGDRIDGIILEDGTIRTFTSGCYRTEFSILSEDLICVANAKGKQGYMNLEGTVVIPCKYDLAHPFSKGWASVTPSKDEKYVVYINRAKPSEVLHVNFNMGDITLGSTFDDNGTAVVGYGNNFAYIDTRGQQRGGFKPDKNTMFDDLYRVTTKRQWESRTKPAEPTPRTDSKYSVYTEGSRRGIKYQGKVVVPPNYEDVTAVSPDGYAFVKKGSRYGIVTFVDGEFSSSFASNGTGSDRADTYYADKKHAGDVSYSLNVPAGIPVDQVSVFVDFGSGRSTNITSRMTRNGDRLTYRFTPEFARSDKQLHYAFTAEYVGMEVDSRQADLSIKRPAVGVVLGTPYAVDSRANPDTRVQHVGATVRNPNDEAVTVTVTLRCDGASNTQTYTIGAGSSVTITVGCVVNDSHTATATVSTSGGESKSASISLVSGY